MTTDPSPDIFLPALASDPKDLSFRESAVSWYVIDEPHDAKCAWHISRLAEYHPQSLSIGILGHRLLMLRPRFRQMIEQRLLRHCRSNVPNRGFVLLNLGFIAAAGMQPSPMTEEEEKRWRKYFAVPSDLDLAGLWDSAGGSRAVEYLKQAIALPDLDEDTRRDLAIMDLLNILERLHRYDEVIEFGRTMPRPASADALIPLGEAFFRVARFDEARTTFHEAIAEDARGYEQGGHASVRAYKWLSKIDQDAGNMTEAQNQLIAASRFDPCCHTTPDDIEALAVALVRLERSDAAVAYLRRLGETFPGLKTVTDEILIRQGL